MTASGMPLRSNIGATRVLVRRSVLLPPPLLLLVWLFLPSSSIVLAFEDGAPVSPPLPATLSGLA